MVGKWVLTDVPGLGEMKDSFVSADEFGFEFGLVPWSPTDLPCCETFGRVTPS